MEVQSCYHQNTLPAQIVWSLSRREGCNYHQRVVEPHSCCRVVSNIFWNFQPWNPWEFMISNLTLRFAHMCFLNWNVETTKRPDANWIFTRFLVGWHICSFKCTYFQNWNRFVPKPKIMILYHSPDFFEKREVLDTHPWKYLVYQPPNKK